MYLNNFIIPRSSSHKHLGLILDENLNYNEHVNMLVTKVKKLINPLKSLSKTVNSAYLNTIYQSFIRPHFDYCDIIYNSANKSALDKLERIHYNAALIVSGCMHGSSKSKVLSILNWQCLADRRNERLDTYMYKVTNGMVPIYVSSIFDKFKPAGEIRNLRNPRPFIIPAHTTSQLRSSPVFKLINRWNDIKQQYRNLPTLSQFKSKVCFKYNPSAIISTTMIKNLNRKEEICLNRLRVDFILRGHLYAHNFRNVIDPKCTFCNANVTTKHFLILCREPTHRAKIENLLQALDNLGILNHINSLNVSEKCKCLLNGDVIFNFDTNVKVVSVVAKFTADNFDKL